MKFHWYRAIDTTYDVQVLMGDGINYGIDAFMFSR